MPNNYFFLSLLIVVVSLYIYSRSGEVGDGKGDLEQLTSLVSDYSTVHGFNWFNNISNQWIKTLIFLFVVIICFGLPTIAIYQFITFLYETKLTDSVDLKSASAMIYPNITVCHAKYFSLDRMNGEFLKQS